MKKVKILVFIALFSALGILSFRSIIATEWTIDLEEVNITVTGKKVAATMNGLQAQLKFSPADLLHAQFTATIQVRSLLFKSALQTKHAHSDKWLDAEKFPTVSFTSNEIFRTVQGYEARGNLNLHGVDKEVTLPFTFQETESGGLFKGRLHIVRKDYGIGKGGAVKAVDVSIEVPVL
ncbi:MAG TPA: hypothetical protein ENJ82_07485 [Bacteroidetes bacterium]|nr:hypothetical protein [Bacteroidota bacterium]